jgi:monothiol glutaredoxin
MVYQDENEVQKVIDETVKNTPIVMFIKGNPGMPQCGFSKGVLDIFEDMGIPFKSIDVLADPLIREGIKRYTQWPTIPQVFVKGEFIGGFDIVRELYEKGELKTMLEALKV